MKKFILSLLILIMCSFGAAAQKKISQPPAEIIEMKVSDSMELLNNPVIKTRLKKLLGKKNYESFLASFETFAPAEEKNSVLFASGCLIHACTHLESAIAVDLANQTVHAAIYNEIEKTLYFNEKRSKTPKVIKDWADRLAALEQ